MMEREEADEEAEMDEEIMLQYAIGLVPHQNAAPLQPVRLAINQMDCPRLGQVPSGASPARWITDRRTFDRIRR